MDSFGLRRRLHEQEQQAMRRAAYRKPNRHIQPGAPVWVQRAQARTLYGENEKAKDMTGRA